MASPRLGNVTSCVAVATAAIIAIAIAIAIATVATTTGPPWHNAAMDTTHKTAPSHHWRFQRHRNAKRHYAEGIGNEWQDFGE